MTWFQRVPRTFFGYPQLLFTVYVFVGYIGAGFLHYRIWVTSGTVETLFTNLGFRTPAPSPRTAMVFFIITGLCAAVVFHRIFARVSREGGPLELVFWGTIASAVWAWVPWLFASSVVSTLFLFLFGMNAVVGVAMARRLRGQEGLPDEVSAFDPWKMFVNATKACATVVALLLGAIATAVLLPWRDTAVEGPGLFRYALLSAYVILGMLAFVLLPLLARSLEHGPVESVDLQPPGVL